MRSDLPELIGGPYQMPRFDVGGELLTVDQGELTVRGITDAPIPWPYAIRGHRPSLCLCGDLVAAVKLESNGAVASWWGVGCTTVRAWRRELGVPRNNPGSIESWRRSTTRMMWGRRKEG